MNCAVPVALDASSSSIVRFEHMSRDDSQIYEQLVKSARNDPSIIGFVLGGSRGKGFATEHSDYDCAMIVQDKAVELCLSGIRVLPPLFDVAIYTLQEFAELASWDGPMAWDRYNWARIRVEVDKVDGRIQDLVDEKGKVPVDKVSKFIETELDHYINQTYRSIKCHRDGLITGYRFEGAAAITPLLDVLFAVHDARLRPYYKYLEWELTEFSLEKFALTGAELLGTLGLVLTDGDYRAQQKIFREVEILFRKEGFGNIFDRWDRELWFMNY